MKNPIDVRKLRIDLFGSDKLPADAEGVYKDYTVFGRYPQELLFRGTVTVIKQRSTHRNASGHRVFVDCPSCGAMIPAGRLHMHQDTGTCQPSTIKIK